jgi:hypothetical protein
MLKRSHDRKVANHVTNKKSRIKNAFGLPAGESCPNMTSICTLICYAGVLEKIYPGVYAVLRHNFDALLACDGDIKQMAALLNDMIAEFRADCEKRGVEDRFFRIHWDGDFFSGSYARAWRRVINANPDIDFWVYTRVPFAARLLDKTAATVYFSADAENEPVAKKLARAGIKIAYLHESFEDARDAAVRLNIKAVKCPENNKKIPLITDNKSACGSCGVCIEGRNNVLFSRTKNKKRKPLPVC